MRNRDDLTSKQAGRLDRYRERVISQGGGGRTQWLLRGALRAIAVLWFRRDIKGQIPAGGIVIVANHVGHLELLALEPLISWRQPRVAIMAMARLFVWRPFAEILSRSGFFPIQRGHGDQAALAAALRLLEAGVPVAIMPEGQYQPGGALGPFRRGPARLALEAGAPLLPMCTHGVEQARRALWPKRVRLQARVGALIYPSPGETPEHLTERLRQAVLDLQEQLVSDNAARAIAQTQET